MRLLIVLLGTLMLTACGQSGPLYLPKSKPAVVKKTSTTQPACPKCVKNTDEANSQ